MRKLKLILRNTNRWTDGEYLNVYVFDKNARRFIFAGSHLKSNYLYRTEDSRDLSNVKHFFCIGIKDDTALVTFIETDLDLLNLTMSRKGLEKLILETKEQFDAPPSFQDGDSWFSDSS